MIAEVARNLTAEGREVNLWQIMTKVNSTVRENPNSSLARLMHRDGQAVFGICPYKLDSDSDPKSSLG